MINRIEFWVNKFCNFFCKYKLACKIIRISVNTFQVNAKVSSTEINFIFVEMSLSLFNMIWHMLCFFSKNTVFVKVCFSFIIFSGICCGPFYRFLVVKLQSVF